MTFCFILILKKYNKTVFSIPKKKTPQVSYFQMEYRNRKNCFEAEMNEIMLISFKTTNADMLTNIRV